MKNKILTIGLLCASAAFLGGCQTTRSVSFQNYDYNTVFKSAVSGLCSDKKLLVYQADKEKGVIWVQSRGILANPPETPIMLEKSGNAVTASVTMQGMNNPWADRVLSLISNNLPASGGSSSPEATPGKSSGTDFEREKLELEKEKLKLEKEKFEFEKSKSKSKGQ